MDMQTLEVDPRVEDAARTHDDHLFWWSPEIQRLHREGRLTEALGLAWSRMEAVEHERPLPWGWAWGVAMLARQMQLVRARGRGDRVACSPSRRRAGRSAEPWESRLADAQAARLGEHPVLTAIRRTLETLRAGADCGTRTRNPLITS